MSYGLSALWRHAHPWSYHVWIAVAFIMGLLGGLWWFGLVALVGFCWMSWELVAQIRAARAGFPVLYVLPSPGPWVCRRLRTLGYTGPVAHHVWEMHVQERTRWVTGDGLPVDGVRRFRHAYTTDRLRWLEVRPPDRALIITTFNTLPQEEMAALQAAGAWWASGPLDPRVAAQATIYRLRVTQQRMFGGLVSSRDRSDPNGWITIYVPPRMETINT